MVIDEKKLRELVIKAIELIQSENAKKIFIPKKKLYVILTEEWNGAYWKFFERLSERDEYDVYVVITSKINSNLHLNNLRKFNICKNIIDEKDIYFDELSEYTTVFPKVPRELVVKTALCIEDTFETKWISKSMEKGQRIIFLKSGLQKFSGKEPVSYRNKILDYYRTLLEFDIEITDFIIQKENDSLSDIYKSISSEKQVTSYCENRQSTTKKVITEKEIEIYSENNQIVLNDGDIITAMARDRAQSLNISIVKR